MCNIKKKELKQLLTIGENKKTFNRVHFSSKRIKWNTPEEVISELDEEFHFTFDPAVPPRFGNFKGNGLLAPWGIKTSPSIVFVNPPYERGITERWTLKAWKEICLGNCAVVVMLLPFRNSGSMRWLRKVDAEIRLCDKRLKFGDAEEVAPFDSMVGIIKK